MGGTGGVVTVVYGLGEDCLGSVVNVVCLVEMVLQYCRRVAVLCW